ncbi:hypothetical protein HXX76_002150 [Chlamydomonas incerta]|uniref:Uncharacterized protein n=1 Tax=Chlamydomonas incerta TaxID=51695 RepID=A0A835WAI7_CHLIN|nr:hypothetical protein HXX76_002150 [Chlamydomonas incerta]|eukprot:KAG2443807.1 hypothetical protein HXX76_002150 [Chlamydomonas incerta]
MAGGSLLLLASHSPYTPPPPAAAAAAAAALDPLAALPTAASINLHLVRLADGVRVGGSRLEGELVDLSGRPASLGVCTHEDLICVLAVRSQVVHLLQVLRGGEEVLPVRCLGPHVREDDDLVLRTADEAEERWRRQRAAEREAAAAAAAAAGRASLPGGAVAGLDAVLGCGGGGSAGGGVGAGASSGAAGPAAGPTGQAAAPGAAAGALAAAPQAGGGGAHPVMPPMRRSMNGDLVRGDLHMGAFAAHTHSHQHQHHPAYAQHYANGGGPGAGGAVAAGAAGGSGASGLGGRPPRATPAVYATAAAGAAATAATAGSAGGMAGRSGGLRGGYLSRAGRGGPSLAGPLPSAPGLQPAGAVATGAAAVAGHAAAPPVAGVLYPPRAPETAGNGVALGGANGAAQGVVSVAVAAADREALAAQQAAARQAARQQQLEQLAAQAGPGAPPPPPMRRSVPGTAAAGATAHAAGGALQSGLAQAGPGAAAGDFAAAAARAHRGTGHAAAAGHPHLQHVGAAGGTHAGGGAAGGQHPPHHATGAGLGGGSAAGGAGAGAAAGAGEDGGEGCCMTGIKQRLLAHLYSNCLAAANNNPRRLQREAMSLFRQIDTYRSLIMRKVYLLDRRHLLIDWRTPAAADLGGPPAAAAGGAAGAGGPGAPPGQFLLLFDLQTTRVVAFKPSLQADRVVESYLRNATAALPGPWAEALAPWDRYNYDSALSAARAKMAPPARTAAAATAAAAASTAAPPTADGVVDRAGAARKLLQLLPPATAVSELSPSPYLDPTMYNYDDRAISLNIRTRPSLEQPISFRPRNRPDRAGFRLEPGPYEAMVVRDRRLARSVSYLVHPDVPFVMSVFSVFQQTSLNINFRV